MTLAWTFSSRKTRGPTAISAWRGPSVAFARAWCRGWGRGVPAEESLLTLDNLHGQTTETFKAYMKKECNSLVWHYPVGCTDALQPIDGGLAALIKVEVGKQLDIWLENGDNLERWENNALTVSDRRVLLTKRVATAVDIVDNRPNYRFRLFEKTGSLMTADGTCNERINLEGLTKPLAFMRNGGETEAAEGGAGGRGDKGSEEESQGGEQDQDEESKDEDEEEDSEDEDSEDSEKLDEDSEEEDENRSEEGSRKRV